MSDPPSPTSEAERLEALWEGDFGDDYVDRNAEAYEHRGPFWTGLHERLGFGSVLEVGANVGGNLQWLAPLVPPGALYGIDVNRKAIRRLHERVPVVNALWAPGRDLPLRDRWFDLVFTMGVLIHQPTATLPLVMHEMVRCSSRWVLAGEYHAREEAEVAYRGHEGALFKRDYGGIFLELFPELTLVDQGFLGRNEGWDDITWWLLERS